MLAIQQIEFWPVDIPITDPFVVATGARIRAENVFVRIALGGGAHGYGEAAPFPEVGGEDRLSCMNALNRLCSIILHRPVDRFSDIAEEMRVIAPDQPSARCALETAMIDAYCRARKIPMWELWGGSDVRKRETDITIPICDLAKTVELARSWHQKGFRIFKMKVGRDVEEDIRRLRAVHDALPGISFIGDGNQGFSQKECLRFTKGIVQFGGKLILLEQPLDREDLDGLAAIRRETGVPVAADESVRSLADAKRVVAQASADYINIKIMKTGVVEARTIADYTRSRGLKLMIGGMVETRVAMGCSFSLVLGMTGFEILDLDTPLLLNQDPVKGGYSYAGSFLIPSDGPGLSVDLQPQAETVVCIS
ncbi:MAG TPA: dipeptide epimerase [Nitrospira sp.]|nr:dipeptide epimerase [Nitrospira sp.]